MSSHFEPLRTGAAEGAVLARALREVAALLDRQHEQRHLRVVDALDTAFGPHARELTDQHGRLQAEAWELVALMRHLAVMTEGLVEQAESENVRRRAESSRRQEEQQARAAATRTLRNSTGRMRR